MKLDIIDIIVYLGVVGMVLCIVGLLVMLALGPFPRERKK